MTEGEVFLFSVGNFLALVAALGWGLRRMARQFFYARRAELRKSMIAASKVLRDAKVRASQSRRKMAGLEAELAERRLVAVASTDEECANIVRDARINAQRIHDRVAKLGEEERARTLLEVRDRLLDRAYSSALDALRKNMTAKMAESAMSRGMVEFDDLLAAGDGRNECGGAR